MYFPKNYRHCILLKSKSLLTLDDHLSCTLYLLPYLVEESDLRVIANLIHVFLLLGLAHLRRQNVHVQERSAVVLTEHLTQRALSCAIS